MAYGNGGYAEGTSLGTAGQTSAPRVPLVMLEVERLMKCSEHLHSIINELENRVAAVTRPEGPTATGTNEKAPAPLVQLAGGLAELAARFEHACRRLQSLNERVEI